MRSRDRYNFTSYILISALSRNPLVIRWDFVILSERRERDSNNRKLLYKITADKKRLEFVF